MEQIAKRIGSAVVVFGLIAMLSSSAFSAQWNRHVIVINNTSSTMTEFYASNIDVSDWQNDILGDDVITSGGRVNINVDDGTGHCFYDFKAVFKSGAYAIRRNVNVCRVEAWTITD